MSPDQYATLSSRLEFIKNKLAFLRQKRQEINSVKELVADETRLLAIERAFQLLLEAVIDVARMLISLEALAKPEDATQIFEIIGQAKIIPEDFARQIKGMGGFRNVLVHEYIEIDYEQVMNNLDRLDDVQRFVELVVKYLEEKGKI